MEISEILPVTQNLGIPAKCREMSQILRFFMENRSSRISPKKMIFFLESYFQPKTISCVLNKHFEASSSEKK